MRERFSTKKKTMREREGIKISSKSTYSYCSNLLKNLTLTTWM